MLVVHRTEDAEGYQEFDDDVGVKNDNFNHQPKGHFWHLRFALGAILEINYLDVYTHTCCIETPTLKTAFHGALRSLSIFEAVSIPYCFEDQIAVQYKEKNESLLVLILDFNQLIADTIFYKTFHFLFFCHVKPSAYQKCNFSCEHQTLAEVIHFRVAIPKICQGLIILHFLAPLFVCVSFTSSFVCSS